MATLLKSKQQHRASLLSSKNLSLSSSPSSSTALPAVPPTPTSVHTFSDYDSHDLEDGTTGAEQGERPFEPRPARRAVLSRRSRSVHSASMSATASYIIQPIHLNESTEFGLDDFLGSERNHNAKPHTSDLADFLRNTGPDVPPAPATPPATLTESKSFIRKYLRKRVNGSQGSPIQPKEARRFTGGSFTSSGVAALNKAMYQVPPPNVEPKVFANG